MQGSVLGPIKCIVQIDTLGRDCYRDMEGLFLYKNMYMDTGTLSLKYLIKIRRLMYLWHILHVDKKELLNKLYFAQKLESSKDDWVEQITKSMNNLVMGYFCTIIFYICILWKYIDWPIRWYCENLNLNNNDGISDIEKMPNNVDSSK